MNNWKNILISAGVPSEHLSGNHGPCPFCGGKDRFRFSDYQNKGDWICNQCGSGNGMEFIKRFKGITEYKDAVEVAKENGYVNPNMFKSYEYKPDKAEEAKLKQSKERLGAMIQKMVPAEGTPAELYLRKRKLDLVTPWNHRGKEVRAYYLPDDEYWHKDGTMEHKGAIVWKVWRGDGKRYGLHRTYIDENGEKAQVGRPKKLTERTQEKRRMAEGGYLYIPLVKGDNNVIILAEGIETALSAWNIMNHVHGENCHTIAMNNDAGISWFMPQNNQVKHLVFADRDESLAGQFAAVNCVMRLHKNFDINVVMPPDSRRDWNDIWMQGDEMELNTLPFSYWL